MPDGTVRVVEPGSDQRCAGSACRFERVWVECADLVID